MEKSSAWFIWKKFYPTPINWKGSLAILVLLSVVIINSLVFKFSERVSIDSAEFILGFIFAIIVFVILAKIKS